MDDLHAHLRDLPVELKAIVLSHIEHLKTRQILALSSTFQEAFSLPGALPRTYDLEGVAGDDIADHLVRLLDDDRVRSLNKERALELIGVHQDRLCEYACVQRNFEVLKWAHNKLELPWATTCTEYPVLYPPGPVSDDVLVLRMLRDTWLTDWWEPPLDEWWPEGARPEDWHGVTMENGRVVKLELTPEFDLTGAVPAVIGRLSALRHLNLYCNQLTSLPAEIGQLTSLKSLILRGNRLTSLPAEIGRLTSLRHLNLHNNKLTSLPAEIGQLTSLRVLSLNDNQLTSLPAEIGQLTSLTRLYLNNSCLTSLPAGIWQLRSLERLYLGDNKLTSVPAEIGQLTSLRELSLSGNQLTSLPAEIGQITSLERLYLGYFELIDGRGHEGNLLSSLPAEIGQLTSLRELHLHNNQLTSVPAEIGQLISLEGLYLNFNKLTSVPAAVDELIAAGCDVWLDYGVTFDE